MKKRFIVILFLFIIIINIFTVFSFAAYVIKDCPSVSFDIQSDRYNNAPYKLLFYFLYNNGYGNSFYYNCIFSDSPIYITKFTDISGSPYGFTCDSKFYVVGGITNTVPSSYTIRDSEFWSYSAHSDSIVIFDKQSDCENLFSSGKYYIEANYPIEFNGDIIYEPPKNFTKPYFVNSDEDLSSGKFENVIIDGGDFNVPDCPDINFVVRKINNKSNGDIEYESQDIIYNAVLNRSSDFYKLEDIKGGRF